MCQAYRAPVHPSVSRQGGSIFPAGGWHFYMERVKLLIGASTVPQNASSEHGFGNARAAGSTYHASP